MQKKKLQKRVKNGQQRTLLEVRNNNKRGHGPDQESEEPASMAESAHINLFLSGLFGKHDNNIAV